MPGKMRYSSPVMAAELLLSTFMVLATVTIHAIGLYILARVLRLEELQERHKHIHPMSLHGMTVTLGVSLGLFVLHGIEIWLYAFLFLGLGSVEGLRDAVYFSTITYGAIGYGDAAMAEEWRLVSAIEGINGLILIGWSTAFFVTLLARMNRRG